MVRYKLIDQDGNEIVCLEVNVGLDAASLDTHEVDKLRADLTDALGDTIDDIWSERRKAA